MKIFRPHIDYLKIGWMLPVQIAQRDEKLTKYEVVRNLVQSIFKMDLSHEVRGKYKTYFHKSGTYYHPSHISDLEIKGEDWYSRRTYYQVKILLNELNKLEVPFYLKRCDIRRNSNGYDDVSEVFKDIKDNFWFNRASKNAFYSPNLFTKHDHVNKSAMFKSNNWSISNYHKSAQILALEKKILEEKDIKEDELQRLKKTIYVFKKEHGEAKDIFRFELRLLEKDKANKYLLDLLASQSEQDFCYRVLAGFYEVHPVKNKARVDSKIISQFFKK